MCVEVVPQQCHCPKSSSTQVTFMRSLVCVALHVSVQVGAPWAGVATQLTLEGLLYTCTHKEEIMVNLKHYKCIYHFRIVKRKLTKLKYNLKCLMLKKKKKKNSVSNLFS